METNARDVTSAELENGGSGCVHSSLDTCYGLSIHAVTCYTHTSRKFLGPLSTHPRVRTTTKATKAPSFRPLFTVHQLAAPTSVTHPSLCRHFPVEVNLVCTRGTNISRVSAVGCTSSTLPPRCSASIVRARVYSTSASSMRPIINAQRPMSSRILVACVVTS